MALDILQSLLGGGQQRQDYQDFVNRYHDGPPDQGYSNQEVLNRYQQVAPNLPQDMYMQSAQDAFARMSPQEGEEFGRWLQTQAQQQGYSPPAFNQMGPGAYQDPGMLGRILGQMHQQQPDILSQMLGGQSGTALDNPVV